MVYCITVLTSTSVFYDIIIILLFFFFFNRGMLSHAVHPPTTEHVYAQWQEREEFSSMAPLGLLQEDNGQSLDVKEEEAVSPMSGEPTCRNHFKTSRAVRLKFKGNAVRRNDNKTGNS